MKKMFLTVGCSQKSQTLPYVVRTLYCNNKSQQISHYEFREAWNVNVENGYIIELIATKVVLSIFTV